MNENEFLIIKTRRGGCWEDDEFATKENLIETLINKAKKQVAIANKRKQEEYDLWYRVYCD